MPWQDENPLGVAAATAGAFLQGRRQRTLDDENKKYQDDQLKMNEVYKQQMAENSANKVVVDKQNADTRSKAQTDQAKKNAFSQLIAGQQLALKQAAEKFKEGPLFQQAERKINNALVLGQQRIAEMTTVADIHQATSITTTAMRDATSVQTTGMRDATSVQNTGTRATVSMRGQDLTHADRVATLQQNATKQAQGIIAKYSNANAIATRGGQPSPYPWLDEFNQGLTSSIVAVGTNPEKLPDYLKQLHAIATAHKYDPVALQAAEQALIKAANDAIAAKKRGSQGTDPFLQGLGIQ